MKNFFRKVAFGLKPDEKAPSDPLTWAQKQVESIPELNWKGKHIYSEKEMRKYWIQQRVTEETTFRKKYKKLFIVTPGIRLPGDSANDQSRVMTPNDAFKNKVSGIVMGRSLIKGNIKNNIQRLIDHLNK